MLSLRKAKNLHKDVYQSNYGNDDDDDEDGDGDGDDYEKKLNLVCTQKNSNAFISFCASPKVKALHHLHIAKAK